MLSSSNTIANAVSTVGTTATRGLGPGGGGTGGIPEQNAVNEATTNKPDLLTAVNWFFALQPPLPSAAPAQPPVAPFSSNHHHHHHHSGLPATISNPLTFTTAQAQQQPQIIPASAPSYYQTLHNPNLALSNLPTRITHHQQQQHHNFSCDNSVSSWNTKLSYSSHTTSTSANTHNTGTTAATLSSALKKRKRYQQQQKKDGATVSISSGETTVESSSERKRIREQNRRAAFAKGVDTMAKVLCQIDPQLRSQNGGAGATAGSNTSIGGNRAVTGNNPRGTATGSTCNNSNNSSTTNGGGIFSNQLRVIHHATTILERIHEESLRNKAIVKELEDEQRLQKEQLQQQQEHPR
mmetsp:Transcript_26270/g.37331  ORF Transcript_26270/g.37331 Transcript_26270/m.37331 type:complete len:352 (+) Transcript_26270:92-1147(+)|eukprot:CAMPEP_0202477516 /NCGR_PEP_ID=MMETSP1360-20130828/93984_1 /ASSEMBLY_ACC=CAM_ASM_000848 /TAXON_ID=515479 /ORGANISM="Licmophora paradoxa, Strain CCMP2313" /LENGTH=351 /DNA_ID=CAMNT_0049104763 /DNA_START=37 /DNA_END=1092 /DNA_ORIENTATION=-